MLTALLALTVSVTIPPQVTGEFNQACSRLVEREKAKGNTTNEECALKLIREGFKVHVADQGRQAIDNNLADIDSRFPDPLRPGVCGDGEVDGGEECDGGPQCGPNCRSR